MKYAFLLTSLLFVFSSAWTQADEKLLFDSQYKGKSGNFKVSSRRILKMLENGDYVFESTIEHALGSIKETSIFSLAENNILPRQYIYKRNIFGIKKQETIDFDWAQKKATYRRKGKADRTAVHDLKLGLFDPSLYQLQLQRETFSSKLKKGDILSYKVIKHRKIKDYMFVVEGEETMQLEEKKYQSLKLKLQDDDKTKQTEIWLIPELNFQIGKIVHIDEDGDHYEIELQKFHSEAAIFDAIYQAN